MSKRNKQNSVPEKRSNANPISPAPSKKQKHLNRKRNESGAGPHKQKGPGARFQDHLNEAEAPEDKSNPQSDNMRVINDNLALAGYRFSDDVEQIGFPEDYFYKIALDTLQVSVVGIWEREDGQEELMRFRSESELLQDAAKRNIHVTFQDEHRFEVFKHGAPPSYQFLMRDGDGQQIRGLPSIDGMPAFIIRFGARWCNERTREGLLQWILDFLRHIGFKPREIKLSEVHLRVDVPTPFSKREIEQVSGTGTRNAKMRTIYDPARPDEIEDFSNRGGRPKIVFDLYNKRQEQLRARSPFWKIMWAAYGIEETTPVWRCEARWRRKALLNSGLDLLSDLTDVAIRDLWHGFASEYIYLAEDATERLDRISLNPKWIKIAACGKEFKTQKLLANTGVEPDQLLKQAAGCIAGYIDSQGIQRQLTKVVRLVNKTCEAGWVRLDATIEERTFLVFQEAITLCRNTLRPTRNSVLDELHKAVAKASFKRVGASSYSSASPEDDRNAQ